MNKYIGLIISISLVIIIALVGYGFYKIEKLESENISLKNSAVQQSTSTFIAEEINVTEESNSLVESSSSSAEELENKQEVKIDSQSNKAQQKNEKSETVNVQNTPKVDTPVNQTPLTPEPPVTLKNDIDLEISEPANEPEISINSVRQTAFADGYGGTYGAYEIEISVLPKEDEILIPRTTNATIGTGNIGLTFSVVGTGFSGVQKDRFDCSILSSGYCKFKADGVRRTMVFTVYLNPDEDGGGSYAMLFENLNYYQNDIKKNLNINRKTSSIQVIY